MKRAWLALVIIGCGGDPDPADPECNRAPGVICTVAGTGVAGDGADGELPTKTKLYSPADIAFSPDNRLVVVDWNNHRIRAVDAAGRMKIIAGTGELPRDVLSDEVTDRLNHPTDVTFDPQGRMLIAAWHNSRIKRCDLTTGEIVNIAGTGGRGYGGDDGPALSAVLNLPAGVVYAPDGRLFVSDQANQRIRVIDQGGNITTFAGNGARGFAGDGGPASEASFNLPIGQQGHPAAHIARGPDGSIYLADTENNRIRRIDPAGMVSTVAGNGTFGSTGNDILATQAQLSRPVDVALGPDGGLYIADTESNCVRVVRDGKISTVAGICGACTTLASDPCGRCTGQDGACLGDGAAAAGAHLKRPTGIAFDRDGNLYIADTLHHRIRVVYR